MPVQPSLFDAPPILPEGMRYRPELITPAEEQTLIAAFADLPFKPFEFHGYFGKRRVVSFGSRYDFSKRGLEEAGPVPGWLEPLRGAVAEFAGVMPGDFHHIMVTEYEAGAAIGWHRDRPEFGVVAGVSLGSPCTFRLRNKAGAGWERMSLTAEPRSAYVLDGPARRVWEHSIPGVPGLRYSVTFRTLAGAG